MSVVQCTCGKKNSLFSLHCFLCVKYLVTLPVPLLCYFKLTMLGMVEHPAQHGQFSGCAGSTACTPMVKTSAALSSCTTLHWEDQRTAVSLPPADMPPCSLHPTSPSPLYRGYVIYLYISIYTNVLPCIPILIVMGCFTRLGMIA